MDTRSLGSTGMQVSPLCLGAMMFGAWGEPDHDASIAIIHAALDGGINFIDTADVYSQGESEEIVGKALVGRRDDVILATKFHGPMDVPMGTPGGDPNQRGNSRRWMIREVESSLRRLQTDYIDLYQVHRWDDWVDHEETLSALTDLRQQGKIRAFGSSTYPAHEIVQAQWTAERFGMGVIPWSPLAGGWLTGRFRKGQDAPQSSRAKMMPSRYDLSLPENQRKLDAAEALAVLAEEAGLSLVHMALAFTLAHPAVTAPIIGPRTMEQLTTQIGAADVRLSDDVLDRIDEIVPPGTTIAPGDAGFTAPALADATKRRRR